MYREQAHMPALHVLRQGSNTIANRSHLHHTVTNGQTYIIFAVPSERISHTVVPWPAIHNIPDDDARITDRNASTKADHIVAPPGRHPNKVCCAGTGFRLPRGDGREERETERTCKAYLQHTYISLLSLSIYNICTYYRTKRGRSRE